MDCLDCLTGWLDTELTLYHILFLLHQHVCNLQSQNPNPACVVGYSFHIFLFVDVLYTSKWKEQCTNYLCMYFTVAEGKNREGLSFGKTTKDVCANLTMDTPEI